MVRIEFYKVDVRITRAHKRTGTSTIRADGGVGGSNYQLNLLADQSSGLNSSLWVLQNATGCGKLNNFDSHFFMNTSYLEIGLNGVNFGLVLSESKKF